MIVSKQQFKEDYGMLDEACRQWYAFIQEDQSRADGVGFGAFYEQLCDEKYQEYRQNPEDFDFAQPKYPIFLSLSEDEAKQLVSELSDHVYCMKNPIEDNPLKSIYHQLQAQIETAEQTTVENMGISQ